MDKRKIYIAAPLFCEGERAFNERIDAILRECGHETFLPQRDGGCVADLLIHDATYGEDEQGEEAALWGHSTFRQAAEIAAEAQVGKLWLTHFSQSMKEPADYLPNAQAIFPNTVCGVDGLAITLRFENSN